MKLAIGSVFLFSLMFAIQPAVSFARGGGGGGGGGGHSGGGGHGGGHGFGGHEHEDGESSDSGWPATGYGYPGFPNNEYGYEDTWNENYGYAEPACGGQPSVQLFYDTNGNVYAARCPNGAIQYFEYTVPQE